MKNGILTNTNILFEELAKYTQLCTQLNLCRIAHHLVALIQCFLVNLQSVHTSETL